MRADITTVSGANDGSGSRIVVRDSSVGHQSHMLGASTVGREDSTTGRCSPLQLMGSIPMIVIEVRGREVLSDIASVQPRRNASDPSSAEVGSRVQGTADHNDHGTVTGGGNFGEAAHDTLLSGGSKRKCWIPAVFWFVLTPTSRGKRLEGQGNRGRRNCTRSCQRSC